MNTGKQQGHRFANCDDAIRRSLVAKGLLSPPVPDPLQHLTLWEAFGNQSQRHECLSTVLGVKIPKEVKHDHSANTNQRQSSDLSVSA